MLLDEIISGSSKSQYVLVVDCADQRGENLLGSILARHKTKPLPIHFLCFERSCAHYERRLGTHESITFHDLFSDPLGWLNPAKKPINIYDFVCSKVADGTKIILCIDSLSSALLSNHLQGLYIQIHDLLKRTDLHGVEVVQLLSVIHGDVEDFPVVHYLSQLASTVITVKPPTDKQCFPTYSLRHSKNNSGKIFTESQCYSMSSEGAVRCHPLTSESAGSAPQPSGSNSVSRPVHDGFSTFRHGLSAEEQAARQQLVLPFERLAMGAAARGQGRIEYVPEEADEWDEEDPDDDLEV